MSSYGYLGDLGHRNVNGGHVKGLVDIGVQNSKDVLYIVKSNYLHSPSSPRKKGRWAEISHLLRYIIIINASTVKFISMYKLISSRIMVQLIISVMTEKDTCRHFEYQPINRKA